jgi:putative flippase GtrA
MVTGAGEAGLTIAVRVIRFAMVGTLCYFVQLGAMDGLRHSMHVYYADVIAFLLSAQLNFILSQVFTWGDRQHAERLPVRWAKFNASVLIAVTVVNALILWLLIEAGLWVWLAMLIANVVSTIWTFVVNHLVVFKAERVQPPTDRGEDRHVDVAHL